MIACCPEPEEKTFRKLSERWSDHDLYLSGVAGERWVKKPFCDVQQRAERGVQ